MLRDFHLDPEASPFHVFEYVGDLGQSSKVTSDVANVHILCASASTIDLVRSWKQGPSSPVSLSAGIYATAMPSMLNPLDFDLQGTHDTTEAAPVLLPVLPQAGSTSAVASRSWSTSRRALEEACDVRVSTSELAAAAATTAARESVGQVERTRGEKEDKRAMALLAGSAGRQGVAIDIDHDEEVTVNIVFCSST